MKWSEKVYPCFFQLCTKICYKLITSNVYLKELSKDKHCQSPMPLMGFTGASVVSLICLKKPECPCFVQVRTAVKQQVTDHESSSSRFTNCWFVHPLLSIFATILTDGKFLLILKLSIFVSYSIL